MKLNVPIGDEIIEFDCFDNWLSRWVNLGVLQGETYPYFAFIPDVQMVLDVGANCGAASVWFSACYPNAEIHAFEPSATTFGLLEANAARRSNVIAHNIGLHRTDQTLPLYAGDVDSVTASVFPRDNNSVQSEMVSLRSARNWLAEHSIERVDVMKVDVEGCEFDVLDSMRDLLPSIRLLYVEYDSKDSRLEIDDLLRPTHWLAMGQMFLSQGEAVYISNDVLAAEKAVEAAIMDLWSKKLNKGN